MIFIQHRDFDLKPKRVEFSAATKRAAWALSGGNCQRCRRPFFSRGDKHHYDHIIPTWISGRNDLKNCWVLCVPCHKIKTKEDQALIARARRSIKKKLGLKKRRGPPIRSRGFDKTKSKRFDGRVVPRKRRKGKRY